MLRAETASEGDNEEGKERDIKFLSERNNEYIMSSVRKRRNERERENK